MGKITSVLGEHNILIRNIIAYSLGDEGNAFIIVDFTNATTTVEDVIAKLKSMPEVLDVAFFSPDKPGYVYETFGFPVTTSHTEDVVILRLKTLVGMVDGIIKQFGSAGEAFLWYLAREGGKSTAKWLSEKLGDLNAITKIKIHLATLLSVGWGRFEVKRLDDSNNILEIEAKDNFEVRYKKNSQDRVNCIFTRGYLTGVLSFYLDREVKVEEVKCEAKGDSSCIFLCRIVSLKRK